MKPNCLPTMIDLFSGCGGVTTGFKAAGWKVLAAVECDPVTAKTYRLNHPEVRLYEADIRNVCPEEMMAQCGVTSGQITMVSVCAPCQPFSRQNRLRNTDERATLVLETIRFAEVVRPLFVFVENVPGLGHHQDIHYRLVDGLERLGYRVSQPTVVDAVHYGVPQFRKRFILCASILDVAVTMPDPTHVSPEEAALSGKPPWLTVKDAFAGLPTLKAGEQSECDPLHKARRHKPLSLERLRHIPPNGGGRCDLPAELQLACHQHGRNVGYHDVYGRMDFERPANTLTTGCTNVTKGRFAHPVEDRAITLREAARLQTFPDTYRFYGTYDRISAQIGNAVPVRLAEIFGRHFYALWKSRKDVCNECLPPHDDRTCGG